MGRVVLDGPVIALSGHGGAEQHAEELRTLVTGLAGRGRRRYGRVAGGIERRRIDVRRAELEAAGVDVGDRVGRRWAGERSGARTVTGETARHALVHAGDRVQRVVTRGGMALRTGSRGRDVVGWLTRTPVEVAQEGGRGRVAAAAVAAR